MKYPVRLFLGNEEVEFSTPPAILFNYSETELQNPTIVKNCYSKTITIEGTKQNNKIFGHIYNLERIQGAGRTMGSAFNPMTKTDFTLYYNSSIYESGYFKLDEVRRNNNNIEYDITLYGGLGDFFYNLSFREDGTPMELSDLTYPVENWFDEPLGFKISKETVKEAWEGIWQGGKWDTINFAPCYNGIPSNLSADKFLINNAGITQFGISDDGYSLGTSDGEHTEWETFDLRSYLQRPVIRVRDVITACCDPSNNGGYEVELDSDFFHVNNNYYYNSWMTLPLLPDLDVPATVESALTVSSFVREGNFLWSVYDGLANASNVTIDINLKFTPSDNYSGEYVYLTEDYWADGGITLQTRFADVYAVESSIMIQLLGYNSTGQIAASSAMYWLRTPAEGDNYYFQTTADEAKGKMNEVQPYADIERVNYPGTRFRKIGDEYILVGESGRPLTIRLSFPSSAEFSQLKLKILPYRKTFISYTWLGGTLEQYEQGQLSFWNTETVRSNVWEEPATIRSEYEVKGSVSYVPVGVTGTTTSFDGFYSGREYTKKDLLTLGVSPASFLLSFTKMFGLYFIKDPESKKIQILTRHNFYKRDEIININDLIDKGSDIKITPVSPQYQYYDFSLEQADSEAANSYRKTYGNDYGTAVVNTGYQFEKEHKALLDGNIFKGGVNVLEKNKYFLKPTNGVPTLVYNGFSYWYKSGGTTVDGKTDPKPMTGETINADGMRFYDYLPKAQFHTAENEASDGSMVLLFCRVLDYDISTKGYHITDDTSEMYRLNDGQPCWLMTRYTTDRDGTTIALNVSQMPVFTRDIYNGKYIKESLDLGTPLTTFVPEKYVTNWQSIYSRGWKSFISDLYDENTRVLNCRCLLRERPNPDWLRRFYWFDNSYWRINNIKDWNISSFDTTEMEFVKVQDISNYDNVEFTEIPIVEWKLDKYSISAAGGVINGYVSVSDGSNITAAEVVSIRYDDGTTQTYPREGIISPIYGVGATEVPVKITLPPNTYNYPGTWSISYEDSTDTYRTVRIRQDEAFTGSTIQLDSYEFPRTGGTISGVVYTTSSGWHFEYSSWATPTPQSGSGTVNFTIYIAPNYTGSQREGFLRISTDTEIRFVQYG